MRLCALCLQWVKAGYLCLLLPLLGRRSADKREAGCEQSKGSDRAADTRRGAQRPARMRWSIPPQREAEKLNLHV